MAAHIHHVANTPNSIPLVFAAENAGAIDFGYQWSAGEFTLSVRGRIVASHVFFCWGSLFADQMRANGMIPDVVLLGGQVFGHLAGRRTDDSGRVRRELQRNGSDHIICVFDSGFKRDIYQTPKMIEEFYETVVTWGLHEPGIGLVIKPKEPLGKGLAATRSLLEQAIATGRCIVVDPAKSTVEAAQAADIVVGIGINTAVIEAALAGVPAVHFDLPGMVTAYPGMEHGMGRFVFRDGAELHAAIKGHMERGGNTTLGDHGDWLEKVDPFQNGKAAQSMGNYLRWYLESIDAGRDSQQAVADATARYSREIGPQYVVSGVDRPADTPRMGRND